MGKKRIVIEVPEELYAQLLSLKASTGSRSWADLILRVSNNSGLILGLRKIEDEIMELKRTMAQITNYVIKISEECRCD